MFSCFKAPHIGLNPGTPKTKREVTINLCLCRKEFKIILDELDWMDDITREKAHDKVDKMQAVIGYAKEILDPELLNQYYEGNQEFISWDKIQVFFHYLFNY